MTKKLSIRAVLIVSSIYIAAGSCRADAMPDWYRAEVADVILTGELHIAPSDADATIAGSEPLVLNLKIAKALKGHVNGSTVILHFPVVTDEAKAAETQFSKLDGKDVIAFAYYSYTQGYFINEYDSVSQIILKTDESEAGVEKEIAQNAAAAVHMQNFTDNKKMDKEVASAVDKLASSQRSVREDGINQLVGLGCRAVPFMIKYMHNNRPLSSDFFFNAQSSDARARLINEHPKTLYDAVSYLLSYTTGISFLRTDQLRTQYERDTDYHGWLVYLSRYMNSSDEGTENTMCDSAR